MNRSSPSPVTVVRRFIEQFWNANDPAVADELVHPEYEIEGIGQGPNAVKRNAAAYRTAFPDLEWVIEQIVANGEWVAVRLTLHGTHLGPLGAIPATGRRVAMKEMAMWQVQGGQIRRIWSVGDALGLRIQLGALPAKAWHEPILPAVD